MSTLELVIDCIPPIVPSFIVVFAFVMLFDKQFKKHAKVFYIVAAVYMVWRYWYFPFSWYANATGTKLPAFVNTITDPYWHVFESMPLLQLLERALFTVQTGIAFYLIVMFIGALPKTPRVKRLFAIRSEMSILGGILVLGHAIFRMGTPIYYWVNGVSTSLPRPLALLFYVVYAILFILLLLVFLVPFVTSFKAVRRRMQPATWKKVQRVFSYPFYALMIILGMALGAGWVASGINGFAVGQYVKSGDVSTFPTSIVYGAGMFWIYLLVGVTYLVLRVNKARNDKRARLEKAAGGAASGETQPAVSGEGAVAE